MKIDWSIVSFIASLLIVVISWGVSVEVRMTRHVSIQTVEDSVEVLTVRVANLEQLLVPIIVNYRVQEELKKVDTSASSESPRKPVLIEAKPGEPISRTKKILEDATRWTHQELEKGQMLKK